MTHDLTDRQRVVLRTAARHRTAAAAADELGITRQTMKNHLSDIYGRLGVGALHQALWVIWLRDAWGDDAPLPEPRPRVERYTKPAAEPTPRPASHSRKLDGPLLPPLPAAPPPRTIFPAQPAAVRRLA